MRACIHLGACKMYAYLSITLSSILYFINILYVRSLVDWFELCYQEKCHASEARLDESKKRLEEDESQRNAQK